MGAEVSPTAVENWEAEKNLHMTNMIPGTLSGILWNLAKIRWWIRAALEEFSISADHMESSLVLVITRDIFSLQMAQHFFLLNISWGTF